MLARFGRQDRTAWLVPERLDTWLGNIGYQVNEAPAGRVVRF